MRIFVPRTLLLSLTVGLAACGNDGEDELREWMGDVRRQTPVSVQKIPAPKTFSPFQYGGKDEVDPYSPAKLQVALAAQDSAKSGLRPDLERRKEPLEAFPLDSVAMVGTLERPGTRFALLRADRNIFQVRAGNYVGQNYGKVTQITDSEVHLVEIVRDAAGEWVERSVKLELQEKEK